MWQYQSIPFAWLKSVTDNPISEKWVKSPAGGTMSALSDSYSEGVHHDGRREFTF
jgi:hypothetical protein